VIVGGGPVGGVGGLGQGDGQDEEGGEAFHV
jgi:hypothetical protein